MIAIDGGQGEGGGQVLRTALSVAAALGRPVTIERVRHNRKPRGLKAQHLACLLACARLTDARVEGAKVGAERVVFEPQKPVQAGDHVFEIGTAGATGLLLHAVSFPLFLARERSSLELRGGTHVDHAPSFDDLELGWAPLLRRAGFACSLELVRTGFYPKGGGKVLASIEPARPVLLDLPRGDPVRAVAVARVASLPDHVPQRLLERVKERLAKRLGLDVEARTLGHAGPPGCAVTLALELDGGSRLVVRALGEKGKPSERVADEACDALLAELHARGSVDEHLADQLLLPLALGAGGSYFAPRVTDHLTTNRDTLALVLPEARVAITPEADGTAARVDVHGARLLG